MTIETWQQAGFGLYLHWPFCQSKCPYCDFNSHVADQIDQDQWAAAFSSEIDRAASETEGRVLSSIFFGGGTPSLMDPGLVDRIIDKASTHWDFANDIEITLEANPSSVEASKFASFAQSGVNRISLGVQALNDQDLNALGRLHSVSEAMDAMGLADRYFSRWSFDLIYARQQQSLRDWEAELGQALQIGARHMSLYQLTIEPETAFGARWRAGKLRDLPDDDLSADMYQLTQEVTSDAGLPSYEVSNHCVAGEESRHNLIYWRCGDYLGIGPGAHGRLTKGDQRYLTETYRSPAKWLNSTLEDGTGENLRDRLSQNDCGTEYALMALRTNEGVSLTRAEELGLSIERNKLKALADDGLIKFTEDGIFVPAEKRILLNSIIQEIIA